MKSYQKTTDKGWVLFKKGLLGFLWILPFLLSPYNPCRADETPVHLSSRRLEYTVSSKTAYAQGDVNLSHEGFSLKAEQMEYDFFSGNGYAKGDVHLIRDSG